MKVQHSRPRHAASVAIVVLIVMACGTPRAHPALDAHASDLTRRIEALEDPAPLLLQRAEIRREHGDFAAARRDLEAALRQDPQLDAALAARARLELEAGQPAEALLAADRFLAKRPGHPEGLLSRARALADLGSRGAGEAWTSALKALEAGGRPQPEIYLEASRALGTEPIDRGIARLGAIPTLIAAGIELELRASRLPEAVARCRAAQSISPSPEWAVIEGETLEKLESRDEARDAFTRALALVEAAPPRARGSRFLREFEARAMAGLAR